MDRSSDIKRLASEIHDAETYGDSIDYLFEDNVVHYGRLCVWYTFSKQLYTILPEDEQKKMDYLFKRKWWTLFYRGSISHKCILLLMFCTWKW